MIFENLITTNKDAFIEKVKAICVNLSIPVPEWLMFVIWFETAKTMNPQKVNFQKGDNPDPLIRCKKRATGLIQFMPTTAKALGTTNENLYKMSNLEQLDYVEKYLSTWKGKYKSFVDLYLAVFYPMAIGKPDTFIIESDNIARQNPIFDLNKDLNITKAEIRQRLFSMIPIEYKHYF